MPNPLANVETWLYHLGDIDGERAGEIGAFDADLVVIEHADYSGAAPRPYSAAELNVMRGGEDRLLVSYLSIGEAEDYRSYWKPQWDRKLPGFIAGANPEWPDNYKVRYWSKAWQEIVFDQVDAIVAQGFDGLYLDIIDAFAFWEEEMPDSGIDYRAEMVGFVAAIRKHAHDKLRALGEDRPFAILGQNGEELVDEPGYLDAVDGIGKEDLRFYYPNGREASFDTVPEGWYRGSIELLGRAVDHGTFVGVIEYMTQQRQVKSAGILGDEMAWLNANGIPLYIAGSRLLDRPYRQPLSGKDVGNGGDVVNGTGAADWIVGLGGADILSGAGGDDTLFGLGGRDRLFGDDGDDALHGGGAADRISGGAGDDVLAGGNGNDALYGNDGADRLAGNKGRDRLDGGPGNDILSGGPGGDVLRGGPGADTADYSEAGAAVVADLAHVSRGRGEAKGDTFNSIENLTGTRKADKLSGNALGNVLSGGNGSDRLDGRGGSDTLHGGNGDDILFGGGGADMLAGGKGDDILEGGSGKDTLVGGKGADSFRFGNVSSSPATLDYRDVVRDFRQHQHDRIDVAPIDADVGRNGDQPFVFIGARSFSGSAGSCASRTRTAPRSSSATSTATAWRTSRSVWTASSTS